MTFDEDFWYRCRSAFAVIVSFAVLLAGGIFVAVKAKNAWDSYRQQDDYVGAGEAGVVVDIPQGATLSQISDILVAKDVIRSAKVFDQVCATESEKAQRIQAGRYNLKTHLPAMDALTMLLDPKNMMTNKFMIIEGRRVSTIEAALVKPLAEGGLGMKAEDVAAALAAGDKLGLPAYAQNNPEGFLFPDTYNFPDGLAPATALQKFVEQFNATAATISLDDKAKAIGISSYDSVIVASIIENEVSKDEDRAKVARVIYNRLEKNMKLDMDSTVHYAVGKDGKVTTSDEDRKSDSPYNTYVKKGLPPTPIGSPGKASLQAALTPAEGDWLYFTTVNLDSGETLFETTIEEHDANVHKFHEWCKASGNGRC